jgi:hypothetical protein
MTCNKKLSSLFFLAGGAIDVGCFAHGPQQNESVAVLSLRRRTTSCAVTATYPEGGRFRFYFEKSAQPLAQWGARESIESPFCYG